MLIVLGWKSSGFDQPFTGKLTKNQNKMMNAIFGDKLTQTLHCMSIYAFVLSLPFKELGERVCTAYFVISAYKHIVQCKRRHLKVALRGGLLINFHAVQSSLKIKLIRDGHFGAVKGQTNK